MAKFKSKVKDVQLYVRVKLSRKEEVIGRELDFISTKTIRGFLRPHMKKTLFGQAIEYTGPMGIGLQSYLQEPVSKYDFLFIVAQFVDAERKLRFNNLFMDHLILDLGQVYINQTTKELQFIYLPLVQSMHPVDPMAFLRNVVYSSRPLPGENPEYLTRFNMFMNSLPNFDPEAVNRFVAQEDPSIIQLIRKNAIGQSGFIASKQQSYVEHYGNRDEDATDILGFEEDEATNLLTEPVYDNRDFEDTGLLFEGEDDLNNRDISFAYQPSPFSAGGAYGPGYGQAGQNGPGGNWYDPNRPTTPPYQQPFQGRGAGQGFPGQSSYSEPSYPPEDDFDFDGTTLLSQEGMGGGSSKPIASRFPKLLRISSNEVISLDKPVFRIGKEKSYVDYFIGDNTAISRSHADIIIRDNQYFISDLNSKNFTFLNGIQLVPNQETQLKDGDKIKFADEEFVFLCS